jgi:tRNA (guanine37-N1)-methyltransferase
MRVDVFSLFPEVMKPYLGASVIGKASEAGLLAVELHQIRDYATDKHHMTDDLPYGGGGGMVMKPEPIFSAVERVLGEYKGQIPIILLTPQGRLFNQEVAQTLADLPQFALVCGRYEGVDERIRQHLVTDEISIGDYVLTGGELPALVVIDAVARLIPGVLGDEAATVKDSHQGGLLEHPHYTRPAEFRGWRVPEILRSGDHGRVEGWRRRQALLRTLKRRPELLLEAELGEDERAWLEQIQADGQKGEPK